MATVLFVWELGGGLGHLMQMLPMAEGLAGKGHRVFMAVRDLVAAAPVFDRRGLFFLPAPHKEGSGPVPCRRTLNFAHILVNVGWDCERSLAALAGAWRNLYVAIRPDLVLFDHSPTALLASRGLPIKRILIGSGFCCPPDTFPFPALAPGADVEQLRTDERRVLDRANRLLASWRRPALERLGQLYSEVHENFLTTFPELEQYPGRIGGRYWGAMLGAAGGKAPDWPAGEGPRVLAYLKPFKALPDLLKMLDVKGCRTIAYVAGLDPRTARRFGSPTLRLASRPLDLPRAARECDLAVLHAGQGATAAVLLAGKPLLQLPLVLEQTLTAKAVERLGAGVTASPADASDVAQKLDAILATDRHAAAAGAFAATYREFDPASQVERMVARIEELLEDASGGVHATCLIPATTPLRTGRPTPAGVFRA